MAQQIVEDGYEKSDAAKQQIQQQQQNHQEQGKRSSDPFEGVEVDGQKLETRRLEREY